MTARTIWIAPNCDAELDAHIRRQAALDGVQVMPAQPFPWNRRGADEKTVAKRKWAAGKLAPKPSQPCDHGLFGDGHLQLDLVEMLQDPTNE